MDRFGRGAAIRACMRIGLGKDKLADVSLEFIDQKLDRVLTELGSVRQIATAPMQKDQALAQRTALTPQGAIGYQPAGRSPLGEEFARRQATEASLRSLSIMI